MDQGTEEEKECPPFPSSQSPIKFTLLCSLIFLCCLPWYLPFSLLGSLVLDLLHHELAAKSWDLPVRVYRLFIIWLASWPGGVGYLIYPWVGRCSTAPHTLTLFKTNIADFSNLFKTEFRFLLPCLRHLINIRACKNFAVYRPRKDILFRTKIDKSIPWLRQKKINSITCLRQKSRKTYPGWPPHVPIKPL